VPSHPPRHGLCEVPENGQTRDVGCWVILDEDLTALLRWGLTLERDLKAACLALGGSPVRCGTAEPGSSGPEPSSSPPPADGASEPR